MTPVLAIATRNETKFVDALGRTVKTLADGATSLRWSPNGLLLARIDAEGRVTILEPAKPDDIPIAVTDNAASISWISDTKLIIGLKRAGTVLWARDAKLETLVKIGSGTSIESMGTTIAFGVDGTAGGVWLSSANGSHSHRIAKGKHCATTSWAYDGSLIAAVVDGHLTTIQPNGFGRRDLGEVDDEPIAWSAGSPYLLARRNRKWSVWNALRDTWTELAFVSDTPPQWTSARNLIGLEGGSLYEQTIGKSETPVLKDQSLVCFAKAVGVYMGESFPDPLRDAPRLRFGAKALIGRVTSWDPSSEQLQLTVESEIDTGGKELNLSKAELRTVKLSPVLSHERRLLPETRLRVVVSNGRVIDLLVPDELPVSAEPKAVLRGHRNARSVEPDGICMDHVVVPMIYPIPGRHHDIDSFLFPREGHRHMGNDLMAPKMTPLLAVFDGTVYFYRSDQVGASNELSLVSDDGWRAVYLHINNDNPGTDDDAGSFRYAFPADLQPGDRVKAGQLVAYCGNSGNAKYTDPHLHFELHDQEGGGALDPYFSLQAAKHIPVPRYADPDPTLKPGAGEERWDGVVVSTDPVRSVLVIELCATATRTAPLRRIKIPQLAYLIAPAEVILKSRDLADLTYSLDSIKPGLLLSAIGKKNGSKLQVRDCSIGLPTH